MSNDYHEIINLVNSYPLLLDEGDHAGLGQLLGTIQATSPAASDPEPFVGADAIKAFYDERVILYDGKPYTRHVITNIVLDIAENRSTAFCRSYFQVVQNIPGASLSLIASGRYHDRFAREDGRWKFTGKKILVDYLGDAADHLTKNFVLESAN